MDRIQAKALESIRILNTAFAIGLFLSFSIARVGQRSILNKPECDASPVLQQLTIDFALLALALCVFAALTASGLLISIKTGVPMTQKERDWARAAGLVGLLGWYFMDVYIVGTLQMKVGVIPCWNIYSWLTFVTFFISVSFGSYTYAMYILHTFEEQ